MQSRFETFYASVGKRHKDTEGAMVIGDLPPNSPERLRLLELQKADPAILGRQIVRRRVITSLIVIGVGVGGAIML